MKGWELIKGIDDGTIKIGTVVKDNYREYYVSGGDIRSCETNERMDTWDLIKNEFQIVEEENKINIQDIKTLNKMAKEQLITNTDMMDKLDEVIQALKQLDKEVKEK